MSRLWVIVKQYDANRGPLSKSYHSKEAHRWVQQFSKATRYSAEEADERIAILARMDPDYRKSLRWTIFRVAVDAR